jgi:hypothetical protein
MEQLLCAILGIGLGHELPLLFDIGLPCIRVSISAWQTFFCATRERPLGR